MTDAGLHSTDTPRFCPRLTLQTLGRGDGLLGLTPTGPDQDFGGGNERKGLS